MTVTINHDEVQSLVFSSHSKLPRASAVWIRVDDAQAARTSLLALVQDSIAFGFPNPKRKSAMQLLVSSSGLKALEIDSNQLENLSREYSQGISVPHRTRSLGDQGKSDPRKWKWSDNQFHAVVMVYASSKKALEARVGKLLSSQLSGWVSPLQLAIRSSEREPFGFRDGLSNPRVSFTEDDSAFLKADVIPSGEVLLGYRNAAGAIPPSSRLGKNGSYVVMRQLSQNVKEFWEFWRENTSDDAEAIWLASKSVGRWPNGMPVTDSKLHEQPEYDGSVARRKLSFKDDVFGDGCPLGSHIRRANPRDGLSENAAESQAISDLHRMLRRGRVYGPNLNPAWYPPGVWKESKRKKTSQSESDPGILFVCLCSDISRQFEFVQQTWLNNPKHVPPYCEVDPISAGGPDQSRSFTAPGLPLRTRVQGLQNFVTVLGGGYFLLPSRDALTCLATGNWD